MSTTGEPLIPYHDMMERALRSLVREALDLISTEGFPGNHHFYISFLTQADGVEMPAHLRTRYPDEMTIVLQHQFWGLETDEIGFSVTLSFGGRSERLTIPFEALTAFTDPTVKFGLQFGRIEDGGYLGDGENEQPVAESGGELAEDSVKSNEPNSGTVVALDKFRKK